MRESLQKARKFVQIAVLKIKVYNSKGILPPLVAQMKDFKT